MHIWCLQDGCGRLCYLVFNLPHPPTDYVFQVRAKVDGEWNRWKSAPKKMITSDSIEVRLCFLFRINCFCSGEASLLHRSPALLRREHRIARHLLGSRHLSCCHWEQCHVRFHILAEKTHSFFSRYYVVVDARDPPGDTNWTELTDKVTADGMKLPYYVGASFNRETLTEPRKVCVICLFVCYFLMQFINSSCSGAHWRRHSYWRLPELPAHQGQEVQLRGLHNLECDWRSTCWKITRWIGRSERRISDGRDVKWPRKKDKWEKERGETRLIRKPSRNSKIDGKGLRV